jgi:hypothetical protein
MKKLYLIIVTFLLLASCSRTETEKSIDLSVPWKFSQGDDPSWSSTDFRDSLWVTISPSRIWEDQGFEKLDGFAWYRLHVMIPSDLNSKAFMKDSVEFELGRIDDYDQVFLNGELIGENGRTILTAAQPKPDFYMGPSVWNTDRRYILPATDPRIHWDKENLIAVRVYDQGGAGGMFAKPFGISMVDLNDYITFDFTQSGYKFEGDSMIGKDFFIENRSGKNDFSGTFSVRAIRSDNGECIQTQSGDMMLKSGTKSASTIWIKKDLAIPAKVLVEFRDKASGKTVASILDLPYILTPKAGKEPRINGAMVFGVRPWSPFLYRISATGEKPMEYLAEGLPEGLKVNRETGVISGYIAKKGDYKVTLIVHSGQYLTQKELLIRCGDLISLTPPLGWNSWNVWGLSVSDRKVRMAADAFISTGLADHGWTYINIDDGWEDTHDKNGNILPNSKFPDMKGMCSYVHSLGLKVGIYSSPGPKTCGGYEGSYKFEEKDAQNYADWGIDYLKYDWCSYGRLFPDPTLQQMKDPYREMKKYIRRVNRDIHYSLCQYGMGDVWKWGAEVDANSWRTTGDITDTWESLSSIGFSQDSCSPYSAPGRWNDPDMLVVGWVGWGPSLHYTRLTPDEQYTHISLWSLLASPLLIGCDLTQLDPFTLSLLTNDEVLAINQDPLGKQANLVSTGDSSQVWMRTLADSSMAVGVFNLAAEARPVDVDLAKIGLDGKWMMRDVWPQKDLGYVKSHFQMRVPGHGARLLVLRRK